MKAADMHCDTMCELMKGDAKGSFRKNMLHIDLEKLKEGDYLLQNFAMFVNKREYNDCHKRCIEMLSYWKRICSENSDVIGEAVCTADIINNYKNGRISAMLTVEEGECCNGTPEGLKELYDYGVRMMTITWNYANLLGYPAAPRCPVTGKRLAPDFTKGLTEKGRIIAEEMQRIGIIIDVSHLSDRGFYDIAEISRKNKIPFAASHSNARKLMNNPRNLTDDMIKSIGELGGVIGINFYPPFLLEKNPSKDRQLECLILHMRHMINKGGIDCVGLGTDFDGIDGELAVDNAGKMQKLYDALRKSGFSELEAEHIFRKNVLRLYREVLG